MNRYKLTLTKNQLRSIINAVGNDLWDYPSDEWGATAHYKEEYARVEKANAYLTRLKAKLEKTYFQD